MRSIGLGILAATLAGGSALAQSPPPQTSPFPPPIVKPEDKPYPGVIDIEVDARDVERGIFSVRQTIPVAASGPMTFLYPEWLPGNHAPRGQVDKFAGLVFSANGQTLPWRRDPVNVYAFHIEIPDGATSVEMKAHYVSPTASNQGRVVATPEMANIQWNSMSLYPAGFAVSRIQVRPSLHLPQGWGFASSLQPVTGVAGEAPLAFAVTDYETLVDSPMFAGKYFARYDLDPGAEKASVHLNVVADSPDLIAPTDAHLEQHRRMVDEADMVFGGARHFNQYDFLLALSEELGGIGLEHHQSSENNTGAKYFTDAANYFPDWSLLPHEYVHSWNGKFRRPADLYTNGYDVPMRNSLLWAYEGQTQFWGEVLTTRAGMRTKQQGLDSLAYIAAQHAPRPGRAWRALVDTTNEPIISSRRPQPWRSWQRPEDYYNEGLLIWLETDAIIREQSGGRRSMDDFAKAFFGTDPGRVTPSTYTFEDVVATLNGVQPFDWSSFLTDRVEEVAKVDLAKNLEKTGWRLVFTEEPNAFVKAVEKRRKSAIFLFSLGFNVGEGAKLSEVLWDSPAFDAGLVVGDQIIAVNGLAYEAEKVDAALKAAKANGAPIEFLVKAEERYRTVRIDYRDGPQHPHLVRVDGTKDHLSALLAPRTWSEKKPSRQ